LSRRPVVSLRGRSPATQYLVIVAREEPALFQHLARRFADDGQVRVLMDRRRRWRQGEGLVRGGGWASVRASSGIPPDPVPAAREGRERSHGDMEGVEERQRIDRWIEESQYLIGRLIPSLLDDRERLRGKLETCEEESRRLRQEVVDLRKEVADLQGETQYFRGEHAAMAEAVGAVLEHLTHVGKPLNDVYRRLQAGQPAATPA
jgi:hypothetical protein